MSRKPPEGSVEHITTKEGERRAKFVSTESRKTHYTPEERFKIEKEHPQEVITWYTDPQTGEESYLTRDREDGE